MHLNSNLRDFVRYAVLLAVTMKVSDLWDVTPYNMMFTAFSENVLSPSSGYKRPQTSILDEVIRFLN
jgi:hypothetical protein